MNPVEQAQQLLRRLAAERFFGTIAFQFKRGEIILVREERTIVPTDLPDGRTDHERSQSR